MIEGVWFLPVGFLLGVIVTCLVGSWREPAHLPVNFNTNEKFQGAFRAYCQGELYYVELHPDGRGFTQIRHDANRGDRPAVPPLVWRSIQHAYHLHRLRNLCDRAKES